MSVSQVEREQVRRGAKSDDRFAGGKPGADTASLKLLWSPQGDRGKQFRLVRGKRLVLVDKAPQRCHQIDWIEIYYNREYEELGNEMLQSLYLFLTK